MKMRSRLLIPLLPFVPSLWHMARAGAAFPGSASPLPLRIFDTPVDYRLDALVDASLSGGPPKDGIPAIDSPQFDEASEIRWLSDGDVVFGMVVDGVARAYPQRILVWHEIVNDTIAGRDVAVTYCPLTATAITFLRGETTFGVSGRLVNSNLIMFDRATDSEWPQVLGAAIRGPLRGQALHELPIVWTTWERWRDRHPETRVLSRNTGFLRNYRRDPYGRYNPVRGYYLEGKPLFPVMHEDNRLPHKAMVLGARDAHGAVAFVKDALRRSGRLQVERDGMHYRCTYDPELDTGRVARLDSPGDRHGHPINSFDAFWFAWVAFYPQTLLVS